LLLEIEEIEETEEMEEVVVTSYNRQSRLFVLSEHRAEWREWSVEAARKRNVS
jgi:hypothetical protein